MEKLGDAHYTTDKNGNKTLVLDESIQDFANHMQEMANNIDNFNNYLNSGGGGMLIPVDANGNETGWNDVMAIKAKNNDGSSMIFNGLGLQFHDSSGNSHALFGVDTSSGEVTGNFFVDQAHIPILDASHIETDTIHSLGTIYGNLKVTNSYMTVEVGNVDNAAIGDESGGGIGISSPNYSTAISSGGIYIHSQESGLVTDIHPSYISVGGRTVMVTSSSTNVMGDWIKRYWRGPSKYWDL